jgi:hypothetical protein
MKAGKEVRVRRIGLRRSRLTLGVLTVLVQAPIALANELADSSNAAHGRVYASAGASEVLLVEGRHLSPETLLTMWQRNQILERRRKRLRLDVEPFVADVLHVIRDMGIPLRGYRDPKNARTMGVTASFSVGEEFPAIGFHLADRAPDTLTAFYGGGKGLSWAFVWPVGQFMMRFEGGKGSEFGSLAIAGAQWNHPELPLAIGIGIPLRMKDAEGEIGVIFQLRLRLR